MFSPSLDSCEVKENREAVKNLVEEINDLVGSLGTDTCISLDEAEQRILEGTHSIRCKLLEMSANQEASAKEPEPVACPKCDKPSHRRRKRERQFRTLCGVIRVNRWEYECGSGHYHRPWDIRQRLKGRYTHRVAEAMCRLSARLTFREASEELLRQGIKVSHTTLHKKVREWSTDLKALKEVERQTLEAYQRWSVSCEGATRTLLMVGKKPKSVVLIGIIHNWDPIVFSVCALVVFVGLPIVRMLNNVVRIYMR